MILNTPYLNILGRNDLFGSFLHDSCINVTVYKCIQCWLINIHIFNYPDSRLSGLFGPVPKGSDNRGSTICTEIHHNHNLFMWPLQETRPKPWNAQVAHDHSNGRLFLWKTRFRTRIANRTTSGWNELNEWFSESIKFKKPWDGKCCENWMNISPEENLRKFSFLDLFWVKTQLFRGSNPTGMSQDSDRLLRLSDGFRPSKMQRP